jgi:hypothetical protein
MWIFKNQEMGHSTKKEKWITHMSGSFGGGQMQR